MVAMAPAGDHPPVTPIPILRSRRRRPDVLFVSGPGGDAARYRCRHQAEQLRARGWSAGVVYEDDADPVAVPSRALVLYRTPWSSKTESFLRAARAAGVPVLADVDDLVFDPDYVERFAWLETASPERLEHERDTAASLRRTLSECDGVVVSTDPLAVHARVVNPNVAVAYNTVSEAMVAAGGRARRRARRRGDAVVVAYLSGTATHDRDFQEAAPAVVSVLERFPHVELWAVGLLTLDARFERFGERVRPLPYRPWRRLPALLARVDVNLAPLEAGNPFTEAKSCLKYLEAGVACVPTIASPTADFRRAIEPGANGFLAAGEHEWREVLQELVASAARRTEVGTAAREDVLARHTTSAPDHGLVRLVEAR